MDYLRPPLINSFSALSIPAYRRGVTFIADNLASFGRSVYRNGAKLDEPHRLDVVLKLSPNPNQPAYTFWQKLFFDYGHHANGYAYIARDLDTGAITGLYNLNVADVQVILVYADPKDITSASLWYWHKPSNRPFPAVDVIHLKGSGDGMIGVEPCVLHAETFASAALIQQRMNQSMRRGTSIIGTVEIPDQPTDEKLAEIVAAVRKFGNPQSEGDVLILTGGAKLNNQALKPADLQLIEQQKAITKAIAQIIDLDPVYLFDRSESQYTNNAEQSGQDVTRFTFRTRIEDIEGELTMKMLTTAEIAAGETVHLNPDALLRGSTAVQAAVVAQLVTSGVETKNEGRAELGLAPDASPESNQLLTPTALASAPKSGEPDAK